MEQADKVSFVLRCRTFCGPLNGSWLCLHGFAIWQQKGKNGAGERFVSGIRTRPSELTAEVSAAIKSLRFHPNTRHTLGEVVQRDGESPGQVFNVGLEAPRVHSFN